MAKLLTKNADYVMAIDPQRRIILDGAVAIRDDRIVAVGKTVELEPRFSRRRNQRWSGEIGDHVLLLRTISKLWFSLQM